MKTSRIFIALLFIAALFAQACYTSVGETTESSVAFVRNTLRDHIAAPIDKVYNASLKAVDSLEMKLINKRKDNLSAEIITRNIENQKITINLKATEFGSTEISIQVSLIGDKTKSQVILNEINKHLEEAKK